MRTLTVGLLGALPLTSATAAAAEPLAQSGCTTSLQSLVDAAPVGGTVLTPACIFRETLTIDRPLTLVGQPGSEIRGSDIWSDWHRQGNDWISNNAIPGLPAAPNADGRCGEPTNRCLLPEQVFVDGTPLTRVTGNAPTNANQFAVDATRHAVLATDPNGHTVEVSTRTAWIVSRSDGITVQSLRMRDAANDALRGAISNDGYSNWVLEDSVLSDAHGAVVSVHDGSNLRIVRNDISRGGDMGVHGTLVTTGLVQGNHIHDNNTDQFSPAWGAGGVKVTQVRGFVLDDNEVDDNAAAGLWCDISCSDVTFANNRVHDNLWQGIMFEISNKATIHDNVVWQNGWGAPTWGLGAGILVSSSANAEVYGNTLAWNKAGISVVDLNRPDRVSPVNDFVHDNVIIRSTVAGDSWSGLSLAWLSDGTGGLYDPASNNRGANNRFWYDEPENGGIRSSWQQQFHALSDLESTPGDTGGSYLSDTSKNQILSANTVPGRPSA